MSQFIQNTPVKCSACGAYPVNGVESTEIQFGKLIHECRWMCNRCGRLVRRDEEEIKQEVKPEAKKHD